MLSQTSKTKGQLLSEINALKQKLFKSEKPEPELKPVNRQAGTSEDWFREIFEVSRDAIFIVDKNANIVDCNQAAVILTGYSKKQLLKMSAPDLREGKDPEAYKLLFKRITSGETVISEAKILRKDGTKVGTEFSSEQILIKGVPYMHTIAHDITELKIAIKSLKENENKYMALFENLNDGIFLHDINGNIVDVNKKALSQLGYTRSEMLSLAVQDLHFPNEIEKSKEAFSTIMRKGHVLFEINFKTKTGKIFPAEVSSKILTLNNQKYILGVVRDITERKQGEEKLKSSNQQLAASEQQLRSANQQLVASEQQLKASNQQLAANEQQLISANQQLVASEQQLKASNQQLTANEQQLSAANQQLEANNQQLAASEQQFRALNQELSVGKKIIEQEKNFSANLVETANSFIVVLDTDANIKLFNRYAERLTGYKKEDVYGKNWFELFIPKKDRDTIPRVFSEVLKELSATPSFENSILLKDGTEKIIIWRNTVLKNENGKITGVLSIGIDITERKQTEEALRKSEKKYRNILENIEESYFEVDIAGNFTFFNDSLCRLFGYPKDELMGMNNRHYLDDENAKKVFQTFNEVFRTGKPTEVFEWEIIKKDGTRRFIEASISLMRDSAGEPTGFHGLVRDITKRKKTEDALKENEAKLSTIIEHSPNGIYVIDDKEKVILINEALAKIVGYPKNEILYQPITKFIDKESKQLVIERYNKRLSGKDVPSHYEFNIIRKNGEKRIVKISASSVKEKTGKSIIVAHMEDVTEKRKYEKAQQFLYNISKISLTEISLKNYLGQIHQELKQLMKADNFYVALYDPANGKYSFPYGVDEYDDFDGLENIKLDGTITDYVRKTAKGQIITNETEREIKEKGKIKIVGKPAPVWLGAPLMNASGEVMGVIAIQDYKNPKAYTKLDLELLEIVANNTGVFIERVKNIENLKNAKEKAEESDRLKSAFLANMSHEIRTPMNGILGFTELLGDSDFSVKEKTGFIENIRKSGDRLLNTVNDIIDISKIETGQVEIVIREVNVNEQIENFCQFFKLEAKSKGLELTYINALPTKQAVIKTDEYKFGSILSNLIKNAIKFTDEGIIQVGYEIVKGYHTDFMLFFVKDTGIGIPASRQKAIFNRFVQADIGDTRAFEGSGLGLAISKSYVEMLGGKIWGESTEGNGSKFYFTLPYHKTEREIALPKKEWSEKKYETNNGHKKILIVEDEKSANDYLTAVLKKISNEILYADNGSKAVELCRNHPDIDLILMDIKMPVMDGYEATRKIREFNKEVTIIAQTANALSSDKKKAFEAGCNDYITKPTKKETLLIMINHHLKKKREP